MAVKKIITEIDLEHWFEDFNTRFMIASGLLVVGFLLLLILAKLFSR